MQYEKSGWFFLNTVYILICDIIIIIVIIIIIIIIKRLTLR